MEQTLEGKKELKDFLHFYIGCDCTTNVGVMKLSCIDLVDRYPIWFKCKWDKKSLSYKPKKNGEILGKECLVGRGYRFSEVKPLLRRLEDMTDEELFEYGNIEFPEIKDSFFKKGLKETLFTTYFSPAAFKFLLSRHFDLFNLIPEGLAIDIKTLK